MNTNRFIGITGGIGSGKSTVSRFLSAHERLPLIDIDQLCRELLETGMPGWSTLKANLDQSYFTPDGRLDRGSLRSALFNDDELRQIVNQLIHPLALDLFYTKAREFSGVVLVDVPLLFEAGWKDRFENTVVIYADPQTCCQRLCSRDKVLPEEAVKAIFSQMRIEEKAMRADHVVDNRYCWLMTRTQVSHLAEVIGGDCCS